MSERVSEQSDNSADVTEKPELSGRPIRTSITAGAPSWKSGCKKRNKPGKTRKQEPLEKCALNMDLIEALKVL